MGNFIFCAVRVSTKTSWSHWCSLQNIYFHILYPRLYEVYINTRTAQKIKFSIKDFFSKYDQVRSFLRIWSHLLKKSLMENFIFCTVGVTTKTSWSHWCSLQNIPFHILYPWLHEVYINTCTARKAFTEEILNRKLHFFVQSRDQTKLSARKEAREA